MSKADAIEAEGVVIECLRGAMFKVKLTNGFIVTATISGKIRQHYIKILEGDSVKVEMSPYDINSRSDNIPQQDLKFKIQFQKRR